MLAVFGIFWLVAWIKVLAIFGRPKICAALFVLPFILYAFITPTPFTAAAIGGAILFGYIFLYFWLLDYFGESGWYWLILIIGFIAPNLVIFAPAILKG